MRKFTLLGALVLFCTAVAHAAVPDWPNGKAVKPSELQTGGEYVLRCPANDLSEYNYFAGAVSFKAESADIVWVLEAASTEGKFYLKKKNTENEAEAYVQTPADQGNSTKVALGAKNGAGEFEFRALTEADITKFSTSQKLDATYNVEYTGRIVVTATNGTESALRNGGAGTGGTQGGTYAGTGGAEWTIWNVYPADDEFYAFIDYNNNNGPVIEQYLQPVADGVVGGFHAEDLADVRTAFEKGKWAEANAALQQLISKGKQVAFDAGKYYTIESAQAAAAEADAFLFESYTTLVSNRYSARWGAFNGVSSLWRFIEAGTVADGITQYNLQSLNSGLYLPKVSYGGATAMNGESAGLYELEDGLASNGAASMAATFAIKAYDDVHDDFTILTAQKNGSPAASTAPDWATETEGCISTYKNLATNWYLRPVETYAVTVPEGSRYATFNLPFAVELPDRITAYTGSTVSDNEITLLPLDGKVVPARCPVVLVADESGSYDLTIAYGDETEAPADNTLSGTLVPVEVAADATAYIMTSGQQGVGFYKVTSETDRTIPANKAYYAPEEGALAATVLSFSFGGGTTGISGVTTDASADIYYDLQGRRVLYPSQGVYVKGNGEKVYIK